MSRAVDMTGKKFGKLTAIDSRKNSYNKGRIWRFVCECGNTCELDGYKVRSGERDSCQECGYKKSGEANASHRMIDTPEYRTWIAMRRRCSDADRSNYKFYGGRGIKVFPAWQESFLAFYEYAGRRPLGTTLDRIDPDGDYAPGNVRWATQAEQCRNRRNSRDRHFGEEIAI